MKDAGFDCEWTDTEDASFLRGVHKYGVGNWDAIRMDPELQLSEVRYSAVQISLSVSQMMMKSMNEYF